MYAQSHKSSSTHSALGEFGTAIDLDDPPLTDEEKNYLETELFQVSSASSPFTDKASSKSKSSTFIPTEILMDETTIQIIQSVQEPMGSSGEILPMVPNGCPEHSVHLPHICTNQTYSTPSVHSAHSTHSCHTAMPHFYPAPPFVPHHREGIKFDSISFHLHPYTSHSSHSSRQGPAHRGLSIQDYISSTRSSSAPKTLSSSQSSPLPEFLMDETSGRDKNHQMQDHGCMSTSAIGFTSTSSYGHCQHSTKEGRSRPLSRGPPSRGSEGNYVFVH